MSSIDRPGRIPPDHPPSRRPTFESPLPRPGAGGRESDGLRVGEARGSSIECTRLRGPRYWRSLDEFADTPEFRALLEREFPGLDPGRLSGPSRRQFLKLMGASVALMGLVSCRWPDEVIVPYASRPRGRTPGVPVRYATAREVGGVAVGLLATSFDGRPIKVDGNPDHPLSLGGSSPLIQASVLDLYDPDRSGTVVYQPEITEESRSDGSTAQRRTWSDFAVVAKSLFAGLRGRKGRGVRVLAEASSSPTRAALRTRFLELYPQAVWHEYEPLSRDAEREGTALLFGRPLRPVLDLRPAKVIAGFESDLFGGHPTALRNARQFAGNRRGEDGSMSRLWCIESSFSLAGAAADERIALSTAQAAVGLGALAAELVVERGLAVPFGWSAALRPALSAFLERRPAWVARLADDLLAHRGEGLVVAGPAQPPAAHALAHLINAVLGNVGHTLSYLSDPDPQRPSHVADITALTDAMRQGEVMTLVILGGNPVYDAPADLEFGRLLTTASNSIHLASSRNETARQCTWYVPRAHYLESWDDVQAWDGTYSVVQPLIQPLYGGKTPSELLALLVGDDLASGHDLVRRTMRELTGRTRTGAAGELDKAFDRLWRRTLHDGLLAGSALESAEPRPLDETDPNRPGPPRALLEAMASLAQSRRGLPAAAEGPASPGTGSSETGSGLELVFTASASLHDGRFANNGWLQELPQPLTKLTWDNALLVNPRTAARLGLSTGDEARLSVGDRSLDAPVYVMPGQASRSMALSLGYGRRFAGRVGTGVGVDAGRLRSARAMYVVDDVKVEATGRRHALALTQDHHAIDAIGRYGSDQRLGELVREATLAEYVEDPHAVEHAVHPPPAAPLWKQRDYAAGHRWGMTIDLSTCIGCNACVVACQAENNIPVVGKDEVARGREMHWIRLDRYFRGDPDSSDVKVIHQPVACHQCENAPCEQVCPVAATVHSSEGLNDMVYNRCVGTRYCSNNCPYKVRRFNWFLNHKNVTATQKMVFNPEVTVRARGVMEKCTFCVQRINAVKITAKNEGREIADGDITPACAEACPTQAIVFGDLNDPRSRVAKLHAENRSYAMLGELFVEPRTRYLARLRNPVDRDSRESGHG